jgi:hypothetical protein
MRPGGLDLSDLFDALVSNESHDLIEPAPAVLSDLVDLRERDTFDLRFEGSKLAQQDALCIDASEVNENGESIALVGGAQNSLLAVHVNRTMGLFKRMWVLAAPQNYQAVCKALDELGATTYDVVSTHETIQLTPMNALRSHDLLPCGSGDTIVSLWNAAKLLDHADFGGRHVVYIDGAFLGRFAPELIAVHAQSKNPVTFAMRDANQRARLCRHTSFPTGVGLVRPSACYPLAAYESLTWSWTGVAVFDSEVDFDPNDWSWKWHKIRRVFKGEVVSQYQRFFEDYSAFGATYVLAKNFT